MKGIIYIGGATLLAIVIVAGSMYLDNQPLPANEGSVVAASESSSLAALSGNASDTAAWQESLRSRVFDAITIPTSTPRETSDDIDASSTFTERFSRAFFQDYVQQRIDAGGGSVNKQQLINEAIKAIQKNVASKKYTLADIHVTTTSSSTLHEYGNEITSTIVLHELKKGTKNEGVILYDALKANDPSKLDDLQPILDDYAAIINDTLQVSVPDALTEKHLALLNAYEAVRSDIIAMRAAFADPLYTVARMNGYQMDANALYSAFKNMRDTLTGLNVRYSNDEPGVYFSTFSS